MIDKTLLDSIIIGRVEPHIYAFSTNTIPNYLKVGDTYRPVSVRLQEWREHFPELEEKYERSAKISEEVYFRDFAVHQFLETVKHRVRLQRADISELIYFSREFFKEATAEDVQAAIADIERDYSEGTNKYQFYNSDSRLAKTFTFTRTESYPLRPNQEKTVAAFNTARANGRKNLLMYAVMRFGKSFTSMCCAVEMSAKLVVVVSAKADVRLEWKKTVESHIKFADYDFITSDELGRNNHAITEKLSTNRKVVVFLTLQDLQGSVIKDKHQEIFGQNIDLLLVDETHFGARAEKYGAVLKPVNYEKDISHKNDGDDYFDVDEANKVIKTLNAEITIHLSGTPYRILMGSEFKKEDIIAFYQFADIVSDQGTWDKEHILDDDCKEWDNPYYGFPQMIRFAFHPNESSRKRLEELRKSGTTYAFSALFKPYSIRKDGGGLHKKFIYESEILDLLEVIDGSKNDENLLGFLDYDKIKEGKMCRHIVIVLPYCAACDALEALIKNNTDKFRNLQEYEIINISGVDSPNEYKSPEAIKAAIRTFEASGKKTITLTVNRMLTGSTVPEWDTMLYLKDTTAPQEYDQAVFRLQNQYVRTYVDDNGDTIKYNMKPQTLLVDFDPSRMFVMQETKSKIYNVNVDIGGNSELEKRIREELRISPIVTVNADKIVEVTAADILKAVSNYQRNKGIKDEALEIPVDLGILDDATIRAAIEKENEIGTKCGLSAPAHEGKTGDEGNEIDIPETPPADNDDGNDNTPANTTTTPDERRKQEISLTKKIQSYYTRILLFAFITKDTVISLSDIIEKIDSSENSRIARNLGLSKTVLSLLNQKSNKFVLSDLDYKIQDLNGLSRSTDLSPEDRAKIAVNKFGKLGDAIVVTPSHICDDMVALLPVSLLTELTENNKILDIAGTAGEFAVALYKRMSALGIDAAIIANSIYTIPKSSICYELTRKLYEMLGLNVVNIAAYFVAEDLLKQTDAAGKVDYTRIINVLTQKKPLSEIKLDDTITDGDSKMKIGAVVGNPPYQEIVGNQLTNKSLGKQLFPSFIVLATKLARYSSLITPSKWFAGNGQDGSYPKLRDYIRKNNHFSTIINHLSNDIFPEVDLGSLNYYLYDADYVGDVRFIEVVGEKKNCVERPLFEADLEVVLPMNNIISIQRKVCANQFNSIMSIVSGRNPFGLPANDSDLSRCITDTKDCVHDLSILCAYEKWKFISHERVTKKQELISKWKVFTSKMNGGAGTLLDGKPVNILGKPYLAAPNSICSNALLALGGFNSKCEAENLIKYMKTKFFRFMLGIKKLSQVLTSNVYQFVPLQDFSDQALWDKPIHDIDAHLYAKYNLTPDEIAFIESMIKSME